MLANNLGFKVTTRSIDWGELSRRAWGSEWNTPDHGVYEFSNGRKFDSTDRGTTGIYGISGINYLMVGDGQYPDMPSNVHMLQETLDKIELL
jgi:hypothetical protein